MHITFIHDAVIPPLAYGGTERIIYWLADVLVQRGHRVSIVARKGSRLNGAQIIPLENAQNGDAHSLIPRDTDVVHLWGTPSAAPPYPFLVTIEGNGRPGETFHRNTVFISKRHAENHLANVFVYNGIDLTFCRSESKREPYLAFLAKASWKVKNLEGAIAVAKRIGLPLKVMGSRNYPLNIQRLSRYFSKQVHFVGMVGDAEKIEILSRAQALVFPVRWHEPFGIAITEALACGCPVLGTPYGSLPEIITEDVGILSDNADELARGFLNRFATSKFDRELCIRRVKTFFSADQMADRYLELYLQVKETGFVPNQPEEPRTRDGFVSNELLPWSSNGRFGQ